ncbi:hypothetical protein D1159_10680 [Pseudoflavonifractor sp. 524-17]|uniref:N-acetylmuramoyl-L-alanine amidase n=1 Tax=Pseudoflavonifractor sp. 524-17 TaxID=2304577 RepID=UPI00137ADEF4|nr:N-acetylmuramoyl-L-alanine amidase [Pseudoflavonifractor sp. 524-17]NCE65027.1 hypothetical protein [Pseudoflavonifractor sp. 524-17]
MEQYTVTVKEGVNIRSGPGVQYERTGRYPQGAAVAVTQVKAGWGRTPQGWVCLTYLERAASRRRTDNGTEIRQDLIASGRKNRPGGSNPRQYITIHETGNRAEGADAAAHAAYLKSDAAVQAQVSWHYTVDENIIMQHLPDGEGAYHAGDGAGGPGNTRSIGIEICVNAGGDFARAQENAASLVRLLREEYKIPLGNVVPHNRWNGKDCPCQIRHTAGGWERFLALCGDGAGGGAGDLSAAVDRLAQAGIVTAADYWKQGKGYCDGNVVCLLRGMADYLKREGR